MKIVTKNKMFVQLDDIIHIINSLQKYLLIPQGIKDSYVSDFLNSKCNKNQFIEFTGKEEIEFLKNFDYILDYDYIKDMTFDEIEQYKISLIGKRDEVSQKINSLKETDIEQKQVLTAKCEMLVYKIYSVMKYEQLKEAETDFILPEEIVKAERRDIKRLLKKLLKK